MKAVFKGSTVVVKSEVKLLGLTLDTNLTFVPYVRQLVGMCNNTLYALRKVRAYMTKSDCLIVYKTMIRPRLEYCSCVLHSSRAVLIEEELEKCQNRAIRVICSQPRNHGSAIFSVSRAREELELPLLSVRRQAHFSRLVHDLCKGKASPYLYAMLCSCGSSTRDLRRGCRFILPSVRTDRGKSAFVYAVVSFLKLVGQY